MYMVSRISFIYTVVHVQGPIVYLSHRYRMILRVLVSKLWDPQIQPVTAAVQVAVLTA